MKMVQQCPNQLHKWDVKANHEECAKYASCTNLKCVKCEFEKPHHPNAITNLVRPDGKRGLEQCTRYG